MENEKKQWGGEKQVFFWLLSQPVSLRGNRESVKRELVLTSPRITESVHGPAGQTNKKKKRKKDF